MPLDGLTACVLVLNDEYYLPNALEATRGYINRYVIYDVGSTDGTKNIIQWFKESNKDAEFFIRDFEEIPPRQVQGVFRNSMIAEAGTPWYLILDGDEVYDKESLGSLCTHWNSVRPNTESGKYYGVFRRIEFSPDLTHYYSNIRTHHRIYTREATFGGPHPGEWAVIKQNPRTEVDIPFVKCFHFHNTLRSSKESEALKRDERKLQKTYHPGDLLPFNLLDAVPLLRKPIADFPVAPALRKLQDEYIV